MLEEVIALDPNFLTAYTQLAVTHIVDASYGWAESRDKSLKAAEELAQKVLSLDDSNAGAYIILGDVHNQRGEIEKGVALTRKGVALAPNSANPHAWLGIALLNVEGKAEEAIEEFNIARRLNPFTPN